MKMAIVMKICVNESNNENNGNNNEKQYVMK